MTDWEVSVVLVVWRGWELQGQQCYNTGAAPQQQERSRREALNTRPTSSCGTTRQYSCLRHPQSYLTTLGMLTFCQVEKTFVEQRRDQCQGGGA